MPASVSTRASAESGSRDRSRSCPCGRRRTPDFERRSRVRSGQGVALMSSASLPLAHACGASDNDRKDQGAHEPGSKDAQGPEKDKERRCGVAIEHGRLSNRYGESARKFSRRVIAPLLLLSGGRQFLLGPAHRSRKRNALVTPDGPEARRDRHPHPAPPPHQLDRAHALIAQPEGDLRRQHRTSLHLPEPPQGRIGRNDARPGAWRAEGLRDSDGDVVRNCVAEHIRTFGAPTCLGGSACRHSACRDAHAVMRTEPHTAHLASTGINRGRPRP